MEGTNVPVQVPKQTAAIHNLVQVRKVDEFKIRVNDYCNISKCTL